MGHHTGASLKFPKGTTMGGVGGDAATAGEAISSAIVKYNYQAQQLDELSLVKGARILSLKSPVMDGGVGSMETKLDGSHQIIHRRSLRTHIRIAWLRISLTSWWHFTPSRHRTTQSLASTRVNGLRSSTVPPQIQIGSRPGTPLDRSASSPRTTWWSSH